MTKQLSFFDKCEIFSKISVYLLVFLLPIFFLPWTSNVLNFNKQALLIFLVFISFFSWMLKIIGSGKFKFTFSWIHIPLLVLLLVLFLSTLFSIYPYGSFWGWPLSTGESFLTFLSFFLLYFLVANIFEREEIFYLVIYLFFSVFLVMVFGILQLFGKFVLPFSFDKTFSFNTIGSVGNLSIFIASLLPLLLLLIIKVKNNLLRIFFITSAVLGISLLVLINFSVSWWLVIVGSILVITLMAQKRDIIDNRWLILPMFFLTIALLFVFLRLQVPGIPNHSAEIFLTQKSSSNIALKTLREKPVFGTGQGTFIFDFAKHKGKDFNKGQLWNIKFRKSGSEFFNELTTTGLLGTLSFLFLLLSFVFYGTKSLFIDGKKKSLSKNKEEDSKTEKETEEFFWVLSAGIFINFLVLSVGYFLYSLNLSLLFIYFLFLSGMVALFTSKRKFLLKPSSLSTLTFTFVFTLFFVFGLAIFILETQRYIAAVNYQKGISALRKNRNSEQAVKYIEGSAKISPDVDLYWRQLAQLYVQRIKETVRNKKISKDKKNRLIQFYINNAVNSAKAAVDTNSKNVDNWATRALVYQKLIGIIDGTDNWAIKSYDSASQLDPFNPYLPTQEGLVYVQQASLLPKDKKDEKNKILDKAKAQFEKAIDLKKDYAPANFQLAMVYQAEGKQEEAIKKLEATEKIDPFDIGLSFQLGLTYYQNKDFKKAEKEFRRVIALNPKYSNALYFLGLTYNKLGLNEKAIRQFEKVSKLNPNNQQVKKILDNLKSGKNIMEGLVKKQPPEVPIKEETKKK